MSRWVKAYEFFMKALLTVLLLPRLSRLSVLNLHSQLFLSITGRGMGRHVKNNYTVYDFIYRKFYKRQNCSDRKQINSRLGPVVRYHERA